RQGQGRSGRSFGDRERDGAAIQGFRTWSVSDSGRRQQQRKRERRALAGTRSQGDVAAHAPNELAGNRQSETGAAELGEGLAVRLRELLEQALVILGCNSNSGIGDVEDDLPRRIGRRRGPQEHSTLLG